MKDFVNIESHYNPNPSYQRTFSVTCYHHFIKTTVTSTPSVARNWLYNTLSIHRSRRHRLVVGLGVQWRPTFTPGTPLRPSTLQLCVGSRCLVFQIIHAKSIPRALIRFLADPRTTFVGVWNYKDAELLMNSEHKLSISCLVDLRHVAAKRMGCSKRVSMEKLASIVLGADGMKKAKWIGRSAWDSFWLSEEQVLYACLDAFLSFEMGKSLRVWNWNR
ncbi:PREDICTED: Werner Syndrome-like exonuclease [Nelumbo nucifera]|uniref:Werner Syndrome-like exonuclease n=2 Tax=Nelumbo nucifera TaxID=4432 RepID=A0A1U8APJ8_NELNU|nr:PREDICTED: Werner Syndrome-like exonuclease [Nelumbo nucifera]DAD33079.1 TPA_asm: hypothetical protein HUJ06_011930 [Nelumbo nucifera]